MPFKLIGTWIRSLDADAHCPPQEFAWEYAPDTKAQVVEYLIRGLKFASYLCPAEKCLFTCDYYKGGGYTELGDGEWVWPNSLSHYVQEHNVRLPDEFLQRATDGTPPDENHEYFKAMASFEKVVMPDGATNTEPQREAFRRVTDLRTKYWAHDSPDELWIHWCRTNRSGALIGRLREGRLRADATF